MKSLDALYSVMKKTDKVPMEKLETSKVRATIEGLCNQYLKDSEDKLKIEVLPEALDSAVIVLDSAMFLERYEFNQLDECCFEIKLRELDLI